MAELGLPDDIVIFLSECGLQEKRLEAIRRNFVHAFANGIILAEIIHTRFPKMVDLHNFADVNSQSSKLDNWKLLNQKCLNALRCSVQEDLVQMIVSREIPRDDLYMILRSLKMKMDSYEPLYLAQAGGNSRSQQLSATHHASRGALHSSQKLNLSSTVHSELKSTTSLSTTCPSRRQNAKILNIVEGRKIIGEKARQMSMEEMNSQYDQLTQRLRAQDVFTAQHVDELQAKSQALESQLQAVRAANLEELKKTERRLTICQLELESLQREQRSAQRVTVEEEEEEEEEGDGVERDQQQRHGAGTGTGDDINDYEGVTLLSLAAAPAPSVTDTAGGGGGGGGHVFSAVDRHRRSSSSSNSNSSVQTNQHPNSTFTHSSSNNNNKSNNNNSTYNSNMSANQVTATASDHLNTLAEHPAPPPPSPPPPALLLYQQLLDSGSGNSYYVDLSTGESSWTRPFRGVLVTQSLEHGEIFTNIATGAQSHAIQDIL